MLEGIIDVGVHQSHRRKNSSEDTGQNRSNQREGENAAIQSDFTALIRSFAATAREQHELPAQEDPDRLAFELHAILLGADTKFVLNDDPAALDLARQVVRHRLGLDDGGAASQS